jgi:hypothetical protein
MQIEILSHNVETFIAEIKFIHNDVIVKDTYNLLLVEPTMKSTLERTGDTFTPQLQQEVINTLASWIERSINRGGLINHIE